MRDVGLGDLGWVGVTAVVVFVLFWALVLVALVLAIRWLVRADQRSRYDGPPQWPNRPTPPGGAPPGAVPPGFTPPGSIPPGPVPPGSVPGHGTGPAPGAWPPAALPLAAPEPDALEVLRLRYARGEIDEDEYERRRGFLQGGSGSGESGGPADVGPADGGSTPTG